MRAIRFRGLQTLFLLAMGAFSSMAVSTGTLSAQEPPDSVRAQLARLMARIDSLEAVVRNLQSEGQESEAEDTLAQLRAAAAEAAAAGNPSSTEPEAAFQGRQRSLQALNPEISVSVDMLAHVNKDDAGANNFVAREFEFSFQSTLDPYSRAKIFVTRHEEGPEVFPFEEGHSHEHEGEEGEGGSGLEIEEGYLEWVSLPGGLSLKLGKFFQRFGALNRWHAHALPFQSRSLPHLAFFGEEPLAQSGASATWLAPFGSGAAYEATVEVTQSSNASVFGESSELSFLTHLNAFWETSATTDLDLGLSWLTGDFEDEDGSLKRNVLGAEMAFTWRPLENSRSREFQFRGGAMLFEGLEEHEDEMAPLEEHENQALGLWSSAELRLSPQWLAGGRIDWVESPEDPEDTAWMVSPTLTWWQSEWVRLRLEYDLVGRSFEDNKEGRLWFWVTFAMGPHKHETY